VSSDDMAVAMSTRIVLLASFVAVSSVVGAVAVAMDHVVAVLLALSRHFFFWSHLPCPGPGMLVVGRLQE
jgi:hypothetical protein